MLVADPHPVYRVGITAVLAGAADLSVVASLPVDRALPDAVDAHAPDLVTLELALKDGLGVDLIRALRARQPAPRILVVSMLDQCVFALPCLRAGAQGYVMKGSDPAHVLEAVRAVASGRIWVHPEISQLMLRAEISTGSRGASERAVALTYREVEILELMAQGLSASEISKAVHISVKTFESHQSHIRVKLGLANAKQLLSFAILWKHGLVRLDADAAEG